MRTCGEARRCSLAECGSFSSKTFDLKFIRVKSSS
jgi:hypothetical protein